MVAKLKKNCMYAREMFLDFERILEFGKKLERILSKVRENSKLKQI